MTNNSDFMPTDPIISDAEWKVMRVLWKKSPQPAYDIIQVLAAEQQWHPNTIKTLLARLHKKKVLKIEKYKSRVSQEQKNCSKLSSKVINFKRSYSQLQSFTYLYNH